MAKQQNCLQRWQGQWLLAKDKGKAAELLATAATGGGGSGWWLKQKTRASSGTACNGGHLRRWRRQWRVAKDKGKAAELLAMVATCGGGNG